MDEFIGTLADEYRDQAAEQRGKLLLGPDDNAFQTDNGRAPEAAQRKLNGQSH